MNEPCRLPRNPNPVGVAILVDVHTIDYHWLIDTYDEPNPVFTVIGLDGVERVGEALPGVPVPAPNDPVRLEFLRQLEREEKEKAAAEPPAP